MSLNVFALKYITLYMLNGLWKPFQVDIKHIQKQFFFFFFTIVLAEGPRGFGEKPSPTQDGQWSLGARLPHAVLGLFTWRSTCVGYHTTGGDGHGGPGDTVQGKCHVYSQTKLFKSNRLPWILSNWSSQRQVIECCILILPILTMLSSNIIPLIVSCWTASFNVASAYINVTRLA